MTNHNCWNCGADLKSSETTCHTCGSIVRSSATPNDATTRLPHSHRRRQVISVLKDLTEQPVSIRKKRFQKQREAISQNGTVLFSLEVEGWTPLSRRIIVRIESQLQLAIVMTHGDKKRREWEIRDDRGVIGALRLQNPAPKHHGTLLWYRNGQKAVTAARSFEPELRMKTVREAASDALWGPIAAILLLARIIGILFIGVLIVMSPVILHLPPALILLTLPVAIAWQIPRLVMLLVSRPILFSSGTDADTGDPQIIAELWPRLGGGCDLTWAAEQSYDWRACLMLAIVATQQPGGNWLIPVQITIPRFWKV